MSEEEFQFPFGEDQEAAGHLLLVFLYRFSSASMPGKEVELPYSLGVYAQSLLDHYKLSTDGPGTRTLSTRLNLISEVVVNDLLKYRLAELTEHRYAGRSIEFHNDAFKRLYLLYQKQIVSSSVFRPFISKNNDFRARVVRGLFEELIDNPEILESELSSSAAVNSSAPAADRTVSFSDNKPQIDEIRNRLTHLEEAFKKDNKKDWKTDEIEAEKSAFEIAKEYLNKTVVFAKDAAQVLLKPLEKFKEKLADKASDALVSEILTKLGELIDLIQDLLF